MSIVLDYSGNVFLQFILPTFPNKGFSSIRSKNQVDIYFCKALHLQILRCAAPTNITVRCTYKYYGALHLQILRCAVPTSITVRCTYKYYGALHLQILRCAASTNITVRCTCKYYGALHLQILRCAAPTNITVRCTCKYYGALHLLWVNSSWLILQILRWVKIFMK